MVNVTAYERELARARIAALELMSEAEFWQYLSARMIARRQAPTTTREARMEEIERRRDTVLAECNPNLPTYEAK